MLWLFFSLSGRLGPKAYLLGGLLIFITQVYLFNKLLGAPEGSAASEGWASAFALFGLLATWCNFALTAKRLHDFGKPGFIAILSVFIGFVLFVILAFFKSDPGPNQYGERPDAPA